MQEAQYPSDATIAAFGGIVEMAKAMGLKKQNIHRWKHSASGYIPRWWSAQVEAAAKSKGIKLPKPKRLGGGHGKNGAS